MDALELLKKWPSWEKANAATVLASPAWRMLVAFDGRNATLKMADAPEPRDTVELDVSFDGEPHVLGLCDSEEFPNLHMLWGKRGALPAEIVLALVEKECGPLLQLLEDVFKKQLSVGGLKSAEGSKAVKRERFFVLNGEGGAEIGFSLDLSPAMEIALGRLDNLDPSHESIRSLSRPADAEFAAIALSGEDFASMGVGDFLLLPEDASPKWTAENPVDGLVRVFGAGRGSLSFAEMADDALPPVPECSEFRLVRFGEEFATAVRSKVGDSAAVKITGKKQNGSL